MAQYAHIANIAVRSGAGKLAWNSSRGKFTNNVAANDSITPVYRKPWELPGVKAVTPGMTRKS